MAADYTAGGVDALLGPVAAAALARGETVPAARRTAPGGALACLVRLFLLQRAVSWAEAARALPVEEAVTGGLLQPVPGDAPGGQVRALVDVRPYAADDAPAPGWWVVSDLAGGLDGRAATLPAEHVVGVGGASTTLAQVAVRPSAGRALDVGTGSGVQALHLSRHSREVVATDVSLRALRLARLTARLCGVEVDLRRGDLYAPVAGDRFDLVVANPPFVVAPRGAGVRFAYRDSGLPGDEVCRRLVQQAPEVLADGGWVSLLANWVHRRGEDWRERLAGWVRPTGCDAWVVQREVQDPAQYAAMWLRDAGEGAGDGAGEGAGAGAGAGAGTDPAYLQRYDAWLGGLEADGVEAVGAGWITMHAGGAADPVVRVEDWPHPVEQPLGAVAREWFARQNWLRGHDDAGLLGARLLLAPDVVQETSGPPGAEHPHRVVLRQQRGMRRAVPVDTVTAALAGACDGSLPVGTLLDAVAAVLQEDSAPLRRDYPVRVRELVADGLLVPPDGNAPAGPDVC